MPRKQRSDSISAAIDIAAKAGQNDLTWPSSVPAHMNETMRELEVTVYESVLTARPSTAWPSYDLMIVARLSGHVAQLIKDEDTLKRTGTLVRSPNNEKQWIRNPLIDAVTTRQSIVNQLSRQIGISVPSIDINVMANAAVTERSINGNRGPDIYNLLAK